MHVFRICGYCGNHPHIGFLIDKQNSLCLSYLSGMSIANDLLKFIRLLGCQFG
jgi:hypothetical protein